MFHELQRKQKRSLFALFFTFALDYFGFALVFGLFGPLILNPENGMFSEAISKEVKNLYLGALFAAFPLSQFLGAPFFGDFADCNGRKKTLIVSTVGQALGYFLSGLAIWLHHFPFLLISRILTGFCSGNRCICMAAIADHSSGAQLRSKSYGVTATLGGISWIASMLAAGLFKTFAIPFWISAALCLCNGIVLLFYMEETQLSCKTFSMNFFKGIRHIATCFQAKERKTLYLFYLCFMIGWGINLFWLSPYALVFFHASQIQVMQLLIITGIFWSLSSAILNPLLLKCWGIVKVTFIGLLGLFLVFLLCGFSTSFLLFAGAAVSASLFGALVWTNSISLISLSSSKNEQGKTMGLSQSVGSLSLLVAPLLAGCLAAFRIQWVYLASVLLIIFSLLVLKLSLFNQKQEA